MSTKFTGLELSGIEEGRFSEQIDSEFAKLQEEAIAYARHHGAKAKDTKSKMVIEISLRCEDPTSEYFSIKTQIKKTLPGLPANTTSAIGGDSQDDRPCLFVKKSGSDANVEQTKLCTDDGSLIDQTTGEIK